MANQAKCNCITCCVLKVPEEDADVHVPYRDSVAVPRDRQLFPHDEDLRVRARVRPQVAQVCKRGWRKAYAATGVCAVWGG